eukprot:CAMPEP_0170547702 /NCGR_PEP_ID=MMETSP0211-20121228/6059_1 /TAXON_ID=311385 /ORGANISM="Pseudokeronopsis sp., Strain OXSARD2" /LENGTH=177 /DNA_ID=CAMNT_0010852853 /DNA_START=2420 /DNA_END=2953 /DNA_ORIENTATION=+
MTYLFSFVFKNSHRAFRLIATLDITFGFFLPIGVTALLAVIDSKELSVFVNIFFYLNPFCPFYLNLMFVCVHNHYGDESQDFDYDSYFPGFLPYFQRTCPALVFLGILYMAMAIYLDYRMSSAYRIQDRRRTENRVVPTLKADEDVINESNKLKDLPNPQDYNVVVNNLEKCYKNGH